MVAGKLLALTLQAPWFRAYESELCRMVLSATLVMLVPLFFASWFVDYLIALGFLRELSALCFGLLHLIGGGGAFVAGFAGGLVLSHCWLSWREKSSFAALWLTTAVHVVHNAAGISLYLLVQYLK